MMRVTIPVALGAALGVALAAEGCGLIEGIGGLTFDLPPDGGGGAGGAGTGESTGAGGHAGTGGHQGAGGHAGTGGQAGTGGDAGTGGQAGAGGDTDAGGGSGAGGGDAGACAPEGYVCLAAPPSGWQGPVAFYEGAPGSVPSCGGAYPDAAATGQGGLSASPATCSGCACSKPAVTCGPEVLSLYAGSACSGGGGTQTLTSAVCAPVANMAAMFDHFEQTPPQVMASACAPSGGTPTLPPPVWATAGVVCGLSGAATTCADGSVCAPPPASPFDAAWCIWQAGADACPAGFAQQHVWETAKEGRGCSSCACGSPGGATCTVTTGFYSDDACQDYLSYTPAIGVCFHQGGVRSLFANTSVSGTPSCPASGGDPTGSVTAVPAVTVCCPG